MGRESEVRDAEERREWDKGKGMRSKLTGFGRREREMKEKVIQRSKKRRRENKEERKEDE